MSDSYRTPGLPLNPVFLLKGKYLPILLPALRRARLSLNFLPLIFSPFSDQHKEHIGLRPLFIVNGKAGFIVDAGAIYIQVPNFRNYFIGSAVIQAKGLGLHLVRSMVEKTGGKIEVDSEEGRGSRFYVYFKDLT